MTTPAAEPKTTPEASPSPTSPPASSTPDQGTRAPMLGFRTRSTNTATAADQSHAGAAGDDQQGPADPLSTDTPSASEPADPDAAPLKLKQKPLAEVVRGLVLGASVALHHALARSAEEQAAGVWLIHDEDEAGGIADPLAKVANRHAGGALVNADASDLIAAGVAAAGYVISNAVKAFQIRRAASRMRRAGMGAPPDEGAQRNE